MRKSVSGNGCSGKKAECDPIDHFACSKKDPRMKSFCRHLVRNIQTAKSMVIRKERSPCYSIMT